MKQLVDSQTVYTTTFGAQDLIFLGIQMKFILLLSTLDGGLCYVVRDNRAEIGLIVAFREGRFAARHGIIVA